MTLFDDLFMPERTKACIYCSIELPLSMFPKHIGHRDNYDTRCKVCKSKYSKTVRKLRRNSSPQPEVCDCCSKKHERICLDHDRDTNMLRGWLCEPCNQGIGKLGDKIEGVENALTYLRKHYG